MYFKRHKEGYEFIRSIQKRGMMKFKGLKAQIFNTLVKLKKGHKRKKKDSARVREKAP